jgi:hypothetical protein
MLILGPTGKDPSRELRKRRKKAHVQGGDRAHRVRTPARGRFTHFSTDFHCSHTQQRLNVAPRRHCRGRITHLQLGAVLTFSASAVHSVEFRSAECVRRASASDGAANASTTPGPCSGVDCRRSAQGSERAILADPKDGALRLPPLGARGLCIYRCVGALCWCARPRPDVSAALPLSPLPLPLALSRALSQASRWPSRSSSARPSPPRNHSRAL